MANFEIRAKLLIAFQQPDTIHALYLAFAHTHTRTHLQESALECL